MSINLIISFVSQRYIRYNVAYTFVRLMAGPIIVYGSSQWLNEAEAVELLLLFSIFNIRMIIEGGITNVFKRQYSLDEDRNSVLIASIKWFLFSSAVFFVLVMIISLLYCLSGSSMNFFLVCLVAGIFASLRYFLNFFDAYLDGNGKSSIYRKNLFFSNLLALLSFACMMYIGAGLYSFCFYQGILAFSFLFLCKANLPEFSGVSWKKHSFEKTWTKIRSVTSETFKTWFIGYFFWSGPTLLAPLVLSESDQYIFMISLFIAKSMYDISYSVAQAQLPQITRLMFSNSIRQTLDLKVKALYFAAPMGIYILLVVFSMPVMAYLQKYEILKVEITTWVWICVLYFFILVKSLCHNIIRATQSEPFFWYVTYNAICANTVTILVAHFGVINMYFPVLSLCLLPMLILSFKMYNDKSI